MRGNWGEHGSCSEVLRVREHFMSYAGAWQITTTVQSKGNMIGVSSSIIIA